MFSIKNENFEKELIIRGIKILDIGYVTLIYFIFGMICAKALDKLFGKFDVNKYKDKSLHIIILDISIHLWLNGIIIYFARNIIEFIPFPLHNISGYSHFKLKELKSAYIFTFSILYFQDNLQGKLKYLYNLV